MPRFSPGVGTDDAVASSALLVHRDRTGAAVAERCAPRDLDARSAYATHGKFDVMLPSASGGNRAGATAADDAPESLVHLASEPERESGGADGGGLCTTGGMAWLMPGGPGHSQSCLPSRQIGPQTAHGVHPRAQTTSRPGGATEKRDELEQRSES